MEEDAINKSYFMLCFSNIQQWTPSWSQLPGFGGSN